MAEFTEEDLKNVLQYWARPQHCYYRTDNRKLNRTVYRCISCSYPEGEGHEKGCMIGLTELIAHSAQREQIHVVD